MSDYGICEQIQEDLISFLDGMDKSILDEVCQIVVDNMKERVSNG